MTIGSHERTNTSNQSPTRLPSASPPTPANRFRAAVPILARQRQEQDQRLLFAIVAVPTLAQVAFHVLTLYSPGYIQRLGLKPDDLRKPAGLYQLNETELDDFPLTLTHTPCPCPRSNDMIGLIFGLLGLAITIGKGAFQALAVIYPSYKTYKALESRSLRASQAMLLYWCITAFVNSMKEFADELFGTYSNFFVWKLVILTLKTAPLIIGPERLYDAIVKPIFEANEEKIDAVVDEAHKLKTIAQEAAPAVKQGDVDTVKEKAAEIVNVVAADATDLVHTIQQQAIDLSDTLQAKSAEYGVAWDRKGLSGVLERTMAQWETLRDSIMVFVSDEWEIYGPTVKQQFAVANGKANEYAPVAKEKAFGIWSSQIAPRLQPIVAKYDDTIKPFVLGNVERVNQVWIQKGGPVRKLYIGSVRPFLRGTVQPFVTEKLLPFIVDSFIPAVVETAIVLKDRIIDIAQTPSDEVRAGRMHHKRRRADARRERRQRGLNPAAPEWKEDQFQRSAIFKRQKTDVDSDVTESKQPELDMPTADVASTSSVDKSPEVIVPGGATLRNRKTNESIDSTLEVPKTIEPKEEESVVSPVEADSDLVKSNWQAKPILETLKQDLPIKEAGLSEDLSKKSRSTSGETEKDSAWASEPRANERSIAAE